MAKFEAPDIRKICEDFLLKMVFLISQKFNCLKISFFFDIFKMLFPFLALFNL